MQKNIQIHQGKIRADIRGNRHGYAHEEGTAQHFSGRTHCRGHYDGRDLRCDSYFLRRFPVWSLSKLIFPKAEEKKASAAC